MQSYKKGMNLNEKSLNKVRCMPKLTFWVRQIIIFSVLLGVYVGKLYF